MRELEVERISATVARLFTEANLTLPADVCEKIKDITKHERGAARAAMNTICDNIEIAQKTDIPICQDTGMAVVFAEVGQDVHITGGSFEDSINEGVRRAYIEGYLRKSVVSEPVFSRKNTNDNTPAVIYTRIVPGENVKITALPKGFGSENMSRIRMFTPSAEKEDIIDFVLETVRRAGSNPCPPILLGIGIGGTFDMCAYLAKYALARELSSHNENPEYRALEEEILKRVNALGIGPQGFGGKTTALGCNIEYYPTHIASLPVAININCHVIRHKTAVI